ncbi:MAG: RNA methyltransferase [Nesterenkonia sp.]|nr:RNA methyltransferase [Nesterenkonia sp.]
MTVAERPAERLTNPRADRVRKVASLAGRSARQRTGLFLVEGPQAVREALLAWLAEHESPGDDASAHGARFRAPQLDAVYFDDDVLSRHADVAALVERLRTVLFDPARELAREDRIFLREASGEVIAAMCDAVAPQGIVAVCRIPGRGRGTGFDVQGLRLGAALCRLQDPGNVGTVIRTADAAGADVVLLSEGTVDVFSPKVVRSAAGSHFHLPLVPAAALTEQVSELRAAGVQVLAAAGEGPTSLTDGGLRLGAPTLWLFGNEGAGLSAEEQELADDRVSIPLYGRAESLNVATAATVCLYASAMAQNAEPSDGDAA